VCRAWRDNRASQQAPRKKTKATEVKAWGEAKEMLLGSHRQDLPRGQQEPTHTYVAARCGGCGRVGCVYGVVNLDQ